METPVVALHADHSDDNNQRTASVTYQQRQSSNHLRSPSALSTRPSALGGHRFRFRPTSRMSYSVSQVDRVPSYATSRSAAVDRDTADNDQHAESPPPPRSYGPVPTPQLSTAEPDSPMEMNALHLDRLDSNELSDLRHASAVATTHFRSNSETPSGMRPLTIQEETSDLLTDKSSTASHAAIRFNITPDDSTNTASSDVLPNPDVPQQLIDDNDTTRIVLHRSSSENIMDL